jgi:hypothetical protein
MRQCLKAFGEAAGEIGFDKPLGDYSEAEALQVIDAIVTCYTDAMARTTRASTHRCAACRPPRIRWPTRSPIWRTTCLGRPKGAKP